MDIQQNQPQPSSLSIPPAQKSLLIGIFFLSGATGLVYEVVWTRLLTLVVGNTHYSTATVLTTFMAGLALGSWLGGKWIDRCPKPLIVYGLLEGAIGIYCFLVPHLIDLASPVFKWVYLNFQGQYTQASLLRFLTCSSILIFPTTLMGATLPVLGKFVSSDPEGIGKDVGTLYAVNTFGAVAGAVSSAFILMPSIGIRWTIYSAAFANIVIAVWIVFGWGEGLKTRFKEILNLKDAPKADIDPLTSDQKWVLVLFGFSGVAALVYQVAWNRIFSLVLGSSIYAFSLILTNFILGLAIGTLFFSRVCPRIKDLKQALGLLQIGIAISALTAIPFFGSIPLFNRWVYLNWGQEFGAVQWANFGVIFALIFFPTFFMGGQFPLVIRLVAKRLESVGGHVGLVYAINTVGTILGAFLAGFVLIPALGIQNTLLWTVMLNALLATAFLAMTKTLSSSARAFGLPAVILIVLFVAREIPAWDKAVISSGSFMPYRIEDLDQALKRTNKILFFKEGIHTTVTTELAVTGNIFLKVNGKTDASLAADMRTQLLSGFLPSLFHENPKTALVVGQGSGVTLGAVEQFPFNEIDLVEISSAVVEGSRFFGPFNHQALKDPRLNIILEDGRNHIVLSEKKYDVIISEPSNPWISGVGALFTKDFYFKVRKRLNPGGIVCVWVHTNMSPESFKSIIKAFTGVFERVTMWESIVGDDYLMIGSMDDFKLPYEEAESHLKNQVLGKDLKRLGLTSVRDLMGLYIMDETKLREFSKDVIVHTDDNSLLEFAAPEYIYKDERDVIVRQLTPYFKPASEFIRFQSIGEPERASIKKDIGNLERSETQVREIKRRARIDQKLDQAMDAFNRGAYENAAGIYQSILENDPEHVMTWMNLGNVYVTIQEYSKAEEAYRRTLEINPYYIYGSLALARLYLGQREPDRALNELEKSAGWKSGDAEVLSVAGLAWSLKKDKQKADQLFRQAIDSDPYYPPAYYYLGIHLSATNAGEARKILGQFLELSERGQANPADIKNAQEILKKL